MNWTNGIPTEEGLYWFATGDGSVLVVELYLQKYSDAPPDWKTRTIGTECDEHIGEDRFYHVDHWQEYYGGITHHTRLITPPHPRV